MELIAAILSGFVLALVAPWMTRLAGGFAGRLLALLPIGLFVYFIHCADVFAATGEPVRVLEPWVPSLGLSLSFHADGLGILFALLISGVGALVLVYAGGYLKGHPDLGRFFAFLLAFMASMLGVVLAGNVLTLFVFWELTSLTSFFLIGFDHDRAPARSAALQALLVTGGGGLALLAGLLLLGLAASNFVLSPRSFELDFLLQQSAIIQGHELYLPILILVLLGAFTKSAQFPFHFWLPSAMQAPTPVSAYLHSATMVKAGIYLLARLSPVLHNDVEWLYLVGGFGAATMLVGGFLALQATDLKQILAYSTISALGTLTMLLGLGTQLAVQAAIVFLVAHALYKATLFLVAGAIDHETGTRDVRQLGGLARAMPITAFAAMFAALSMAGLPLLVGFLAKEQVYEAVLEVPGAAVFTGITVLAGMIFVAVAGITGVLPFIGPPRETPKHAHEAPFSMWIGPILLATGGLVFGILPGLMAEQYLDPAITVILGATEPIHVHLVLWHGWTLVLTLSAITLAGGLVLLGVREVPRRMAERGRGVLSWGPARWYELGLAGLNCIALWQTRVLQNGYLRYYVLMILFTTVGLMAWPLLEVINLGELKELPTEPIQPYEIGLIILLLMATLTVVLSRSRFGSIVALGVVGYCVAMVYVLYGGPDLAMTQFLIETLTVILFVLVFYHLPGFADLSGTPARLRDALIAVAVGGVITLLVLMAAHEQFSPPISNYYLAESVNKAHGHNVVNVILVDFRGIDTLGEIIVLSLAGAGVYALLKLRPPKMKKEELKG